MAHRSVRALNKVVMGSPYIVDLHGYWRQGIVSQSWCVFYSYIVCFFVGGGVV